MGVLGIFFWNLGIACPTWGQKWSTRCQPSASSIFFAWFDNCKPASGRGGAILAEVFNLRFDLINSAFTNCEASNDGAMYVSSWGDGSVFERCCGFSCRATSSGGWGGFMEGGSYGSRLRIDELCCEKCGLTSGGDAPGQTGSSGGSVVEADASGATSDRNRLMTYGFLFHRFNGTSCGRAGMAATQAEIHCQFGIMRNMGSGYGNFYVTGGEKGAMDRRTLIDDTIFIGLPVSNPGEGIYCSSTVGPGDVVVLRRAVFYPACRITNAGTEPIFVVDVRYGSKKTEGTIFWYGTETSGMVEAAPTEAVRNCSILLATAIFQGSGTGGGETNIVQSDFVDSDAMIGPTAPRMTGANQVSHSFERTGDLDKNATVTVQETLGFASVTATDVPPSRSLSDLPPPRTDCEVCRPVPSCPVVEEKTCPAAGKNVPLGLIIGLSVAGLLLLLLGSLAAWLFCLRRKTEPSEEEAVERVHEDGTLAPSLDETITQCNPFTASEEESTTGDALGGSRGYGVMLE